MNDSRISPSMTTLASGSLAVQVDAPCLGMRLTGSARPLVLPPGWHWIAHCDTDGLRFGRLGSAQPEGHPEGLDGGHPEGGYPEGARCTVKAGRIHGRSVLCVRIESTAPHRASIRLNGLPAGAIAIQAPGDELWVPGLSPWQLVERFESLRARVDAESATRSCAVCRTALIIGRFALTCSCGAMMHDDEAGTVASGVASDVASDDALGCARLSSSCPSCLGHVGTEPRWHPDLGEE